MGSTNVSCGFGEGGGGGVILGFYRVSMRFYEDYIGIVENKMETTIILSWQLNTAACM